VAGERHVGKEEPSLTQHYADPHPPPTNKRSRTWFQHGKGCMIDVNPIWILHFSMVGRTSCSLSDAGTTFPINYIGCRIDDSIHAMIM